MNYSLKTIPTFEREAKQLSKKYKSFKADLLVLRAELLENPKAGTSLGNSLYKVRFPIASKNKGKSGGARAITHVVAVDDVTGIIYLLTVYDKSEQATISDKRLKELLKEI